MDYRIMIQGCIDYIEENLKAEISTEELASLAGFSLYHFQRVFSGLVGMPVARYILVRRLNAAICDIAEGKKMTDTALDYGFDTYAGFYRAFRREFGFSPKEYLDTVRVRRNSSINLFRKDQNMINQKNAKLILTHWGMEQLELSPIIYESSGIISDSALYVGNEYVLKLSDSYSRLAVHNHLAAELEKRGISAGAPVPSLEGKDIVTADEGHYSLTRRLCGKQLHAEDFYATEGAAEKLGGMLAALHLELKELDIEADSGNIFDFAVGSLDKFSQLCPIPEDIGEGLSHRFPQIYPHLPVQIIHRDPNPANIIRDGDNWGFVDFELSERNIRIFDICYAATAILSESFGRRDMKDWLDVYLNIIGGYDRVSPLSAEEKEALPYVVLCNQIISTLWFSEQEQYTDLFVINKKMTEAIMVNFDHLKI